MSTTLPLFWHLSSSSKTDRIEASVKIVGALEQFQASFTPIPPESSSEDDEEDEDEDMDPDAPNNDRLDGTNAPDVSYSIRRLVRGLASPRESSRLGFAVALTELLSRLDTISASQILALITQASQTHGSMKGQEERDMFFARLFGITSLIRSGILFRSTPLSTSSLPACTVKDFQNAMSMLLALPSAKSFLREPSYWTFILALRALDASEVEWKDEAWSWVAETVFVEDKTWSPEKLAVALIMQGLGVEKDWKAMLAPEFKNGDILSSGSLSNVAKILRDVDVEDTDAATAKSKSAGVWKPQLHFVWNLIFDVYFPPTSAAPTKLKPKTSFPDFFKIAVDDSLLAPTSSDGRKLWGFELFRLSLKRVPASELPRLFGPNFMRSWVNHLSKPDRYLHKAAKLVASSLPSVITANPSAGFPLLLQLTQTHGHFDRLTRTKTVESMLAAMDVEGVQEYVRHLGELARSPSTPGEGENDPSATRIWVADQFTALIRNGAIPKTDQWVTAVLNFFVLHSLFGIRKKNEKSENQWLHVLPDPAFSDEARTTCRTRLLSCLAELTSQTALIKTGDDKTVRSTGVASDGKLWVSKVLHGIVALERDTKHVVRLGLGEEEAQEEAVLRDRTLDVIKRLKDVPQDRKEPAEGAELILVGTLLYRYMNDERESDQDVETCLANVTQLFPAPASDSSKGKKKKKKQPAEEDHGMNETDIDPIDALVDTLIGDLEKSTAYLRVIANQVFGLLTGLVGKGAVDLILAQLERRDPTKEEKEDDEMEGLDEDEDGDDAQSDKSNSDSDSNSQRQDDEDEDEDIEDDPELRRKIEEALRVSGIQAASEGSDGSGSDSSDEDVMDDDQMMQLDAHLAEIFRSRAKEKNSDTGAQREATHFKNRVLDLVDIFLRKQPTSDYVPHFLLPLVQVIMGTGSDEKQLSDKVTALLRSRVGKAKELPATVDLPYVRETLKALHVLARKTHSSDARETISTCSLYLTRVLLSDPTGDDHLVIEEYRASLTDFATRKASPLQPSFILDFVRRQPHAAWQLRDDFVQLTNKAVNVYRKCQMFQLLQPLLNQIVLAAGGNSEVPEFMRSLRHAIFTTITDACDDTDSLSAPQVKDLLKLSLLGVRQTKRVTTDPKDLQAIWDVPGLISLSEKLGSSRFKTATSLQALCKQLQAVIGGNPEVGKGTEQGKPSNQKKRKAEEMKDEGSVKKARRKKTKKSKE